MVFFGDDTDPRSRNRQRCLLSRLLFLRLFYVGVGARRGAEFSSRGPRRRRRRRLGDRRRCRVHARTCDRSLDVSRPRRQHPSRLPLPASSLYRLVTSARKKSFFFFLLVSRPRVIALRVRDAHDPSPSVEIERRQEPRRLDSNVKRG